MAPSAFFSIQRREPVLLVPSQPTPHEIKNLSDIDDQENLRIMQVPVIQYYSNEPSMIGQDPVKVIKEALSKALVYYYPLAGRLREGPKGKLVVECTGEGVLFIEAKANIRLEQFGDQLPPPVPCLEELLYDIPGSGGIIDCPLLLIQVTRLICGGFIFALRFNHAMTDASGILQFMTAVGEIARGAATPTVLPAWERQLLDATTIPPHASHVPYPMGTRIPHTNLVQRSFFFTSKHISALKNKLPPHLRTSTAFDVLAAFFWRSCMAALLIDPDDEVRFVCAVTIRSRSKSYLPLGFYGNSIVFPVAQTKAGDLRRKPLSYAVELVKKAKSSVTHGSLRSMIGGGSPFAGIGMHPQILRFGLDEGQLSPGGFWMGESGVWRSRHRQ